jgi:antitoxin StbD
MAALLNRPEQAVSATAMVRNFSSRLKDVISDDISHLVIFKDNEPAAVLMGTGAYQAMQDELGDLRSELLTIERLLSLENDVTVSLKDMAARFK